MFIYVMLRLFDVYCLHYQKFMSLFQHIITRFYYRGDMGRLIIRCTRKIMSCTNDLKKIMDGQHDRPPREVLCPNCQKAAWKASLPPGWDDDNKFVGTDYWGWVAHCYAHNIKFDRPSAAGEEGGRRPRPCRVSPLFSSL